MMDWNNYINSLKKTNMKDIPNIIKERINENSDENDEYIVYGFGKQRDVVFFGELYQGLIANPSILTFEDENNLCEELYNMLQNEFPNVFQYDYEHSFSGEYDYYGYTNDDSFAIRFPNFSLEHQKWIFNRAQIDRETKRKTR